jgi:hypothetical protein
MYGRVPAHAEQHAGRRECSSLPRPPALRTRTPRMRASPRSRRSATRSTGTRASSTTRPSFSLCRHQSRPYRYGRRRSDRYPFRGAHEQVQQRFVLACIVRLCENAELMRMRTRARSTVLRRDAARRGYQRACELMVARGSSARCSACWHFDRSQHSVCGPRLRGRMGQRGLA